MRRYILLIGLISLIYILSTIKSAKKKSENFYIPSNANKIIDGLWLGNLKAASDESFLRKNNINRVISIINMDLSDQSSMYKDMGISHHQFYLLDAPDTNLKHYFNDIIGLINKGKNVLVHCHAGISRSATAVIAYIINKLKMSYADAFSYVRDKRSIINPNYGFVGQLISYDIEDVNKT